MFRFTLIFIIVFSATLGFAQEKIQFNNYTINSGLSQSVAQCIVQDNFGIIWIGTQDGLNKFDGKNFQTFTSGDTKGIENEFILSAVKNQDGKLYFGTYNGVIEYNPVSEVFKTFHINRGKQVEAKSICVDNENKVWIGSGDGRLLFINAENQLEVVYDIFLNNTIVDVKSTNTELILFTDNGKITRYNKSSKKTINNSLDKIDGIFRRVNKVVSSDNDSYTICTSKGLIKYNTEDNTFTSLLPEANRYDISDALPTDFGCFLATKKNGLLKAVKENDVYTLINYKADIFQKRALVDDNLNFIYEDKKSQIWIGSQRGVSNFNPLHQGIVVVGVSAQPSQGLITQNVWSFETNETNSNLFIGNDNGVSVYNTNENVFHHFKRNVDASKNGIATLALLYKENSEIYTGSFNGLSLLKFDTTNYSNYSFSTIQPNTTKEGFDQVYRIIRFSKNELLIGTRGGVMIYNETTNSFNYLVNKVNDAETIGRGICRLVFKTKEGKYYAAPSSGGLFEIKRSENGFVSVRPKFFNKLRREIKDYISSYYQDKDNEFWLGTMGGGLYHLNTSTGEVKAYRKEDGIPNEVIYSIHSTDGENLFMSSNRGIIKFNIQSEKFTSYREEDGLTSDEFNLGASFKDNEGNLYFGGIQGYNIFKPENLDFTNQNLNVYFSEVWIENEQIQPVQNGLIQKSITISKEINLPYKHRTLMLKFYSDAYQNPNQINFKYKLVGDDEVEESLGNTNELRFTSLAPGEYELQIYAQQGKEGWNKTPAILKINVAKPFWMTWWFRILALLVLAFVIYVYIKRRIDHERREQVILEMKIKKRTKELELKNEKIEQQKNKIEEQKKKIEVQKAKVEEQKAQSESILENVLPQKAVEDLKKEGKADARGFEKVSVMFTDFVGFTTISDNMDAQELVSVLDKYFRKFDDIIGQHELEKIKTIGDAYMCAGGVPIRNKTNPIDTVLAGLKIREYVKAQQRVARERGEIEWKVRIGINTGAVSAGIIGTKRFAYDVWGKTVNHAQRMERLCQPGRLAITGDTFEAIEAYFECSFAGVVESKSKGKIDMYYVDAIKPELSVDGDGILPNTDFQKLVNLHFYSSINYMKAEREIMSILRDKLSPALHYHSISHTKDVTRQAERIAIGEGITDNDLFLLKTAASYHDAGFVEQYEKNEPIGARMATEILPDFGYTQEDIKRIGELIFATTIPHQPKNKLEEIICDADLDYLGRDDFHPIADKLRLELREHGVIDSDRLWDEMQVKFLNMHKYFTKTSIETRRPKKIRNMKEVEERLLQNNYKD